MYFSWKPYVPVAERRQQAERLVAKLKNAGHALSPVTAGRGLIAKTFWGKAWCQNLERYSDYANRLRGRAYVRNASLSALVQARELCGILGDEAIRRRGLLALR